MNQKRFRQDVLPLEGCQSLKTLYIIGNGFDLAHGIKSAYGDFRKFEKEKGNGHFVEMMEVFFSNNTEFWSDVETALGDYDEDSIIDYCNPNPEFDYDHPTSSEAAYCDSPDFIFQPLLEQLTADFRTWVEAIDLRSAKRLMSLSREARYLTFNYTDTLETVYDIPKGRVLHIHGKRFAKDEYVVGHGNYFDSSRVYDNDDIYFKQETRAKVIDWMNGLYKDTDSIIRRNDEFFDGLADIEQVFVLGHSLSDIDRKYFERIVAVTSKDIPWTFSFYKPEDVKVIKEFAAALGLTNTRIIHFDDLCDLCKD